jgi:serine/threonine protein kinase
MAKKKLLVLETASQTYRAIEPLGEGGSGRVYRAIEGNDEVAVKVLDPAKAQGDKRKRFINELHFGLRNTHKHLIKVLDHGVVALNNDSAPFFVMPYYRSSLRRTIAEGIRPEVALKYFGQLLDGVEAAHLLGVVHRDIKPENVLRDPDADLLVISDFGIARFVEEDLFTLVETAPNARLANFQYAAPEQRRKGATADHRSDIFALGCILNEMFTKEVPHGTGYKSIASVAPDYAYLDGIVERMLRQDPLDRLPSVAEVKKHLLANQVEWVTLQRLSSINRTVIAESDVDDPLILDPVRVIGVDYRSGSLILKLSQPVTPKWIQALRSISRTAVLGAGPEHFQFRGDEAAVSVSEGGAVQTVEYFKKWITGATEQYRQQLIAEKQRQAAELRRQVQQQREEEQRRLRVLKRIKI